MSVQDDNASDKMLRCANCGITEEEGDGIKLKTCTACKSVKYCGIKCQKEHRPKHKQACKQRAAELRDELLFKQPENTHIGDCPICFLPLPLHPNRTIVSTCCSKIYCLGCDYECELREIEEGLEAKCAFCRKIMPEDESKQAAWMHENRVKRAEKNDPVAIREMGVYCWQERDFQNAFRYYSKAAKLGNIDAHYDLSDMYNGGCGIAMDRKKSYFHLEEAAIGGHPDARFLLGGREESNGRFDRAVLHYTIGSKLGEKKCLKMLQVLYKTKEGLVSKDDLAETLRAYQAIVDGRKSKVRDAAEVMKRLEGWTFDEYASTPEAKAAAIPRNQK